MGDHLLPWEWSSRCFWVRWRGWWVGTPNVCIYKGTTTTFIIWKIHMSKKNLALKRGKNTAAETTCPKKNYAKKPPPCPSGWVQACGGPTDTDFLFNYFLQFIAEPTASPVTTMPYSIPNSYRKALTGMTGAGDVGASLVVSNALLCLCAHETLVSLRLF